MIPEWLERVLMDRALGALDADVSAMLDDYLADRPAARDEQARIASAVALAGTVCAAAPLPMTLPPLRVAPAPSAPVRSRPAGGWKKLAAIAATILLAGYLALGPRPSTGRPQPAPELWAATPESPTEPDGAFWSVDRLRSRLASSSSHRPPARWASPTIWPVAESN